MIYKIFNTMVEFIIVHRELPPFTELGRQLSIQRFQSFRDMIEFTCNDVFKTSRYYQFNYCKYHITILIYFDSKIEYKLRFDTYGDFKKYCLEI